ncbi:MAG: hypothetical protein PHQ65_12115 [Bacteroidales bacterium]|nr:hypothetical protein [Bacteroidales bacterium]MDD3666003.1 hypothetical protein [Bacteroidales bacterium]
MMIKKNRINRKATALLIVSFSLSTVLWADPPPPPPPGGGHGQTNNQTGGGAAPIGSGIMMLVVTASVYGAWRSWKPRQEDII